MKKLLIADDNMLNRFFLKELLKKYFYIIEAKDGKEALNKIKNKKQKLDAIILDYEMSPKEDSLNPKYYGDYISIEARKLYKGIPIILRSSYANELKTKLEKYNIFCIEKDLKKDKIILEYLNTYFNNKNKINK